jgi:hypothetical protein
MNHLSEETMAAEAAVRAAERRARARQHLISRFSWWFCAALLIISLGLILWPK